MRPVMLRSLVAPAAAAALIILTACGGGGNSGAAQASASATAKASGTAKAHPLSQTTARPPAMVGVTTRGALVVLSSVTGAPVRTLVPNGVLSDEISVSPDHQLVYFSRRHGCVDDVYSVSVGGGKPVLISTGSLPAISPDGAALAFARQPTLTPHCMSGSDMSSQFSLVIHTLSTGVEHVYPMLPSGQTSSLPAPISHLSWSPTGTRLAVSISAIEDNEGWQIVLLDPASAQDYMNGQGDTSVPVTGADARQSYWREGVFMPDGNLFVSRACCAGEPVRNRSKLMWEVTTAGRFRHLVAIGFPGLQHTSLAVNRSGKWLLYVAGTDLYVSEQGARPRQLGGGLAAAAWI
jgi:dipeptidyl aminopeptidase/acylaminoacyl peptidase